MLPKRRTPYFTSYLLGQTGLHYDHHLHSPREEAKMREEENGHDGDVGRCRSFELLAISLGPSARRPRLRTARHSLTHASRRANRLPLPSSASFRRREGGNPPPPLSAPSPPPRSRSPCWPPTYVCADSSRGAPRRAVDGTGRPTMHPCASLSRRDVGHSHRSGRI